MRTIRHLSAGIVFVAALAALTGSAFAAPPATPPGQENKAEQAQPAPAADQGASQNQQTPPGQAKKAEQAAPTAAPTSSSSGINSTSAGVKPSNDTDKNTSTTAGANPDKSKRYGNGSTAAQIATSRGAPASTLIKGPGNSQPHKVCGKNGKFVDVHAVKAYTSTTCAPTTQAKPPTQAVTPPTANVTTVTPSVTPTVTPTATPAAPTAGVAGVEQTPAGGPGASPAGGAAGALGALGTAAGGTLPFTGLPLWAAALAGIAAIALGWALLRRARPATHSTV